MAQQVTVDQQTRRGDADAAAIREGLRRRLAELRQESDQVVAMVSQLRGDGRESVGDDADLVSQTSDLDREASIVTGLKGRIGEVEHALERLDAGRYGWCEDCGGSIPVERLLAFPSATFCVSCKNARERR